MRNITSVQYNNVFLFYTYRDRVKHVSKNASYAISIENSHGSGMPATNLLVLARQTDSVQRIHSFHVFTVAYLHVATTYGYYPECQ